MSIGTFKAVTEYCTPMHKLCIIY